MQLRLEKERIQREEARRQQQVPLPEKRRRRPKEDLAICALLALYPAGTPLPESADKQTLKLVNDWFEANGDATRISPDTLARALSRIRTGIRN
jgi:hypothetical protein